MDKVSSKLTVLFEDPFWVGVFERVIDGKLSVSKVVFGAEPKDYEVWDFILNHYYELKFSPFVEIKIRRSASNPKRTQREVQRHIHNSGIGTKSQQALQMQREEMKTEHRQISKAKREFEKEHQYEMKQQKRKKKHKGH